MVEIRALLDGGRSLDTTAAKRKPTEKMEPIAMKRQPQKNSSLDEASWEEVDGAEAAEEELIVLLCINSETQLVTHLKQDSFIIAGDEIEIA